MVVAEMADTVRDVARSCSVELWQQMTSESVLDMMDRFPEVAEAAAVRGGNSPADSSGVQQRKVEQKKQRKHSWAVRKQKRIRSRGRAKQGKKGQHQQDAVPKGRRAEMTIGSKSSIQVIAAQLAQLVYKQ